MARLVNNNKIILNDIKYLDDHIELIKTYNNLEITDIGIDQNLILSSIPGLISLTISDPKFNKEFELVDSLEELIFTEPSQFDQPIILNNNLIELCFGYNFDQPIILNNNLKQLYFGKMFNQQIELNNELNYLVFGDNFNQPIELNKNLIELDRKSVV